MKTGLDGSWNDADYRAEKYKLQYVYPTTQVRTYLGRAYDIYSFNQTIHTIASIFRAYISVHEYAYVEDISSL